MGSFSQDLHYEIMNEINLRLIVIEHISLDMDGRRGINGFVSKYLI